LLTLQLLSLLLAALDALLPPRNEALQLSGEEEEDAIVSLLVLVDRVSLLAVDHLHVDGALC